MPLDGSESAERILPIIAELVKQLNLNVVLFCAYISCTPPYADTEECYEELVATIRDEAVGYLEKKTEAMKKLGVDKVVYGAKEGFAADEIISLGRKTPDNLIAMCTHEPTPCFFPEFSPAIHNGLLKKSETQLPKRTRVIVDMVIASCLGSLSRLAVVFRKNQAPCVFFDHLVGKGLGSP